MQSSWTDYESVISCFILLTVKHMFMDCPNLDTVRHRFFKVFSVTLIVTVLLIVSKKPIFITLLTQLNSFDFRFFLSFKVFSLSIYHYFNGTEMAFSVLMCTIHSLTSRLDYCNALLVRQRWHRCSMSLMPLSGLCSVTWPRHARAHWFQFSSSTGYLWNTELISNWRCLFAVLDS